MSWQATARDTAALRHWLEVALKAQATRKPPDDLPPDFAAWISHLFWLQSCLEAHVLPIAGLSGDEAEGLRLLDEATRHVSTQLKRCPHCGGFSETELSCSVCKRAFAPKAQLPRAGRN